MKTLKFKILILLVLFVFYFQEAVFAQDELSPVININIQVYRGTRANNDPDTPNPCDGRMICFVSGRPARIIQGSFAPDGIAYKVSLGKLANGKFLDRVYKTDITPSCAQIVFGDGKFVMDADCAFDGDILQALGVNSCIIKKGNHTLNVKPTYTEFEF